MALLPIPDGLESFLVSPAREIAYWGYTVQASASGGEGTWPDDNLARVPYADSALACAVELGCSYFAVTIWIAYGR